MSDHLAALRAAGWSVAVHHDFVRDGAPQTYWLFTHTDGRWLRGEGRTDEDAIRDVATNQSLASTRPDYDAMAERCGRMKRALWWAETILVNMATEHTTGWRRILARWLTQSRIHDAALGIQGDCTRAAVASFLGLDLIDVPDFNMGDALAWHKGMEAFFALRGYELLRFDSHRHFRGLYLAGGPSPRGVKHMVVMWDGEIVHDPHMSRAGLKAVEHVWVPVPLDPATRLVPMPAHLDSLSQKASDGIWHVTAEKSDGCDSYVMRATGSTDHDPLRADAAIFDTFNSEAVCQHEEADEDGRRAWDEQGRVDLEYVAELVNWHRGVQVDDDPLSDLVSRFSVALLAKLRAAEAKHDYGNDWARSDWRDDLCLQLIKHVTKGDPLDVAAYAAFAWHHGWSVGGGCCARSESRLRR